MATEAVTDDGVLERMLLDAAVVIGGMDRGDVPGQIKKRRDEDGIREYPSQRTNP